MRSPSKCSVSVLSGQSGRVLELRKAPGAVIDLRWLRLTSRLARCVESLAVASNRTCHRSSRRLELGH